MGNQRAYAGGRGWLWGMLVCLSSACGEELVIPFDEKANANAHQGGLAATQGVTGVTGGAAGNAGVPTGRLPVPDAPVFTTFGGAGGEAGEGEGSTQTPGGASSGTSGTGSGSSGAPIGNNGGHGGHGGYGGYGTAGAADAGSGAGGRGEGAAALWFSEYVEGSGSFKALEIYAPLATSLEGCAVETYSNGKTEPSRLELHGELLAGSIQVLCSSTLAAAEPTRCSRSTNLTFNGDDALALVCQGTVLDVFGQIGVDPGASWGEGATVDHTLRRACSVTAGRLDDAQPFLPATEWSILDIDVFSDLGLRSCPF